MERHAFNTQLQPSAVRLLHSGTGTLLALQAVLLLPDLPWLYGPAGLADEALFPPKTTFLTLADIVGYLSPPLGMAAVDLLYAIAGLYIVLNVLLALGRLPWLGILFLLLLHGAWHTSGSPFSYGVDYLSASALFYCLCTPRARPQWHRASLRLLQVHLCIIYFFSGLAKALGATWWTGEAIWKAVNQPYHLEQAPAVIAWAGQFPWLWTASGWAVIVLELGYPAMVWRARWRRYWLPAVLAMHAGIALCLGLYHFSAIMALLNLAAFHYAYNTDTEQPLYPSDKDTSLGRRVAWKQPNTVVSDTKKGGINY